MARIIRLTGGILRKESTVTSYLKRKGLSCHDADQVVRDLQVPGGASTVSLVDHFGEKISYQRSWS